MVWTLCTSGAAIAKAGANVNSNIISYVGDYKTILDTWSLEAEDRINAECHTDFVANHATYLDISGALSDICSSLIAMNIVAYDTTGYLAREADILLNVNDEKANRGLAILKDKNKQRLST